MVDRHSPAIPANASAYTLEDVQAQDLRFRRDWFYLMASILAWRYFWDIMDRNADNPSAQFISWVAVFVAVWLTNNF
jgi:hypothetical protein